MKSSRHPAVVLVAGIATLLIGTVGVAASWGAAGGGPWLLGALNHAKQTTTLVSNAGLDKATVKIENKGDGAALSLITSKDRAPFTVNSRVKVGQLNADRLDGLNSTQLLRSDQPVDADTIDGKKSNAFVQVPPNPLSALVLNTEPQSVVDTTVTPLLTYFEVYDPSDMHWAVNPDRFMAPRTGTYLVSATVSWAANGVGWRSVELRTNDSVVSRTSGPPAGASVPTVQTVTGIVHLEALGAVGLKVSQSSGDGALDATMTAFEFAYIGS